MSSSTLPPFHHLLRALSISNSGAVVLMNAEETALAEEQSRHGQDGEGSIAGSNPLKASQNLFYVRYYGSRQHY